MNKVQVSKKENLFFFFFGSFMFSHHPEDVEPTDRLPPTFSDHGGRMGLEKLRRLESVATDKL